MFRLTWRCTGCTPTWSGRHPCRRPRLAGTDSSTESSRVQSVPANMGVSTLHTAHPWTFRSMLIGSNIRNRRDEYRRSHGCPNIVAVKLTTHVRDVECGQSRHAAPWGISVLSKSLLLCAFFFFFLFCAMFCDVFAHDRGCPDLSFRTSPLPSRKSHPLFRTKWHFQLMRCVEIN